MRFRFSLRAFLIATVAAGTILGWQLRKWEPRATWLGFTGQTTNGIVYDVEILTGVNKPLGGQFTNAVILPFKTDRPSMTIGTAFKRPLRKGLELRPNGVFWDKRLIAGHGTSRIVLVLSRTDLRVIKLSSEDCEALNIGGELRNSEVWKKKVEPEIDRLMMLYPSGGR